MLKLCRLNDINNIVDTLDNNITKLIKKYSTELMDYKYVETLDEFIILPLKGTIRYINKYNGILKFGGLLIKIYYKNNSWYCTLKQISGKKYNISFKSNHIFYCDNNSESFRNWAECFITEVDAGKYQIN